MAGLSLLAVLVLAMSASAEGAWVLWELLLVPPGMSQNTWQVRTAHPTAAECVRAIDVVEGIYERSTPKGTIDRSAPTSLSWWNSVQGSPVLGHDFRCLPDTVDPRGPKGK